MEIETVIDKYKEFFEESNYDILQGLTKEQYYIIEYDKERSIIDFFVEINIENIEHIIEALVSEDMDIFFETLAEKVEMIRKGIEVNQIDEELMRRFRNNLKLFVSIENKNRGNVSRVAKRSLDV